MSNIGYHTRLFDDHSVKIVGGSFGGSIDMETANRLVSAHFTVTVKHSGTAVFVDRMGREVRLYISVDANKTAKGVIALKEWRAAREVEQRKAEARWEEEKEELDVLMGSLSHAEIVRRLKGSI